MISTFLREQKRYTQKELCGLLHLSPENAVSYIRKLKEYGILKIVSASDSQKDMSDLLEEDVEIADVDPNEDNYLYVFTFVGVIAIGGRVLKCCPKYLIKSENPEKHMKLVLRVLQKYNSKEQIIRMFNGNDESKAFNLLAVFLFLLSDYYENGVYNNTEEIIESNGTGEILWDKTINETFALITNNRPFYVELKTRRQVADDFDYFKRLHESILTIASAELSEAGLTSLFDITEVSLSDEKIDEFGDREYILSRIEKELAVQFNTRKQLVLKTMYTYIAKTGSLTDIECFSMFGTNNFNLVWEDVCQVILDNQLDTPLGLLKLPQNLKPEYSKRMKLIDLIEKPFWSITGLGAKDTLIPDVISIWQESEDGYWFIISDAKYYTAQLEKGIPPRSQPGVESVTKQYLYQLAYQKFINAHGFSHIINCFLMPTEENETISKGYVSMSILGGLGLANIEVRLLPAEKVYNFYLSGAILNIVEDLKLKNGR